MKRFLAIAFLSFSLSLHILNAGNSDILFNHLSVSEGLSQNTVTAIAQDSFGCMWFGTKDGLNRYDGNDISVFRHIPGDQSSIRSNQISCLFADKSGDLWIGTNRGISIYRYASGIFDQIEEIGDDISSIAKAPDGIVWIGTKNRSIYSFDTDSGKITRYGLENYGGDLMNVECIAADSEGTIWIGEFGKGLFYSDDGLISISKYISPLTGENIFENDFIHDVEYGLDGRLYVSAYREGAIAIDIETKDYERILPAEIKDRNQICRCISSFSESVLVLGCESGLFFYDKRDGSYSCYRKSDRDPWALSDGAVYSICQDRDGGLWIGTSLGGVNFSLIPDTFFEIFHPSRDNCGLKGKRVRNICMDTQGRIWVSTEDGLNLLDPSTKQIRQVECSSGFKKIESIAIVAGMLWVGTLGDGIWVIDPDMGTIVHHFKSDTTCPSLVDDRVFSIECGPSGNVYIGTHFGIQRYDSATGTFIKDCPFDVYVFDIKEDTKGNLWLASYSHGLFVRRQASGEWEHYVHNDEDERSLPDDMLTSIYEDSRGQIWFTTRGGGICRFNDEENDFQTINVNSGLPNDFTYVICEDVYERMWVSTNSGLSSFDMNGHDFQSYTKEDGLPCEQFNYQSGIVGNNGFLYFGSVEGLISFHPDNLPLNSSRPSAFVSEIKAQGEHIDINKMAELKAGQNTISLMVTVLCLHHSRGWKLSCRLDGLDETWMPLESSRQLQYSHLKSGNYSFRIRAYSVSGAEHILQTIPIHINRPLYLSWWAMLLYAASLSGLLFLIVSLLRWKNDHDYRMRIAEVNRANERRMFDLRMQFYTNVAHEIRTPVTLIKGPLENVMKQISDKEDVAEDLHLMKRSTQRLMDLINQLLDFRRVESDTYKLTFSKCNISSLIKDCVRSFSYEFKESGKDFKLEIPDEDIFAHVNPEAFVKILSNLISNGLKYSDSWVALSVEKSESRLIVKTSNDGYVVPLDKREDIFKPFVRIDSGEQRLAIGTGIGLVLSRSLAELHGGALTMSDESSTNEFILDIPLLHEEVCETDQFDDADSDGKTAVLLVEDDRDMRDFLKSGLSSDYSVRVANDANAGLKILEEAEIDVIITDRMMPGMDGLDFCRRIKGDVNFSHIPIIMLTADTSLQSKISSMESGAELFIEKPFSMDYLKAGINTLYENRKKLRQSFQNAPLHIPMSSSSNDLDRQFINSLSNIISANYEDPDFRIDDVAVTMGMSKSNFYRKIKGVMDMTPNDLLRLERLKRAAELLLEGKYRISEICYMVGFSSPSYFAKCFQRQFGMTPKEYCLHNRGL